MKFIDELVFLIKQKKELSPLDNSFVEQILLSDDFSIDKKYSSFDKFKRSKQCKILVSTTRKKLRDIYGLFLDTPLLSKHIQRLSSLNATSLLSFHKSTQERAPYYDSIYPMLFDKLHSMGLKKDFILADLACGYNPLAYQYLPLKPKKYFACDLSSTDMTVLNEFFKKFNLDALAKPFDLLGTSFDEYISKHKFDVCFLFKALDPLELVQRHSSKKLLSTLQSSFFVVSFSLFSIGGKVPISISKRSWFENFCVKQGWELETLQIPNELFYVIKTKNK